MSKGYRAHFYVLVAVATALLCGADQALFHALTDAHFSWFKRKATGDIVLVAIDPQSLKKTGVWPWPRTFHAQLLDKLRRAEAADIVFDVDFSSRQAEGADESFSDALKKAQGSIVLPTFVQAIRDNEGTIASHVTKPLPQFHDNSWSAMANVTAEKDGLVRRYAFGAKIDGEFVPSIGALLAGAYSPRRDGFYIDFGIRADTVPTVSYVDVLEDAVPKERLAGKKIIIGATAVELGDHFNVPNGEILAGPLLQTLAAESLLQGRSLSSTSTVTTALGLIGIASLMLLAWRQSSSRKRLALLLGTSIAIEFFGALLHARWGILLDTSLWQIAVAGYLVAAALEEIDFRGLMARIAEHRFRRVAMSIGDGLVCTDQNGNITFWNPGATHIFGYGQVEMLGRPLVSLLAAGEATILETAGGAALSDDAEDTGKRILERTGVRKSGETFALEASVSRWKHADTFHYGFVFRDISERKKEEERIRFLAEHDVLTGLTNRSKLNDELTKLLAATPEGSGEVTLILLGLDGLKEINDTLGQDRGDRIICALAIRLDHRFSTKGIVARVNGDEFAIVLPMANASSSPSEVIDVIAKEFSKVTIHVDDRLMTVTSSLGSAVYPRDAQTATVLMANAALALQQAKLHNRGEHVSYRTDLRRKVEATRQLEQELKQAFERNEFEMFYQPQIDLKTRKIVGAEALIRWRHPEKGLIPPGAFLPVLDTMPLSDAVGRWVIQTASKQAADWNRMRHEIRIGINLSPTLFSTDALPDVVARAIVDSGVPPSLIELEITENILFKDDDKAAAILNQIRDSGVAIAFDDFGTGYASLTHLKRYPIDRLKIDQTFIRDMLGNKDDKAIVGTIVGLGKLLGMHLIAEGIEDGATAEALTAMGCEEGQGYFFGRPVPAEEFFETYLAEDGRRLQPAHTRPAICSAA